jgi:hypothetical protein
MADLSNTTDEVVEAALPAGFYLVGTKVDFVEGANGYSDLYVQTGSPRYAPHAISVKAELVPTVRAIPNGEVVTLQIGRPAVAFGKTSNKPYLGGQYLIQVVEVTD